MTVDTQTDRNTYHSTLHP